MYRNIIIIVFSLFFFISCKTETQENFDFDDFTMNIPSYWEVQSLNGIDSRVFVIITDTNDSIFTDFGKHSSKLNETYKIFPLQNKAEMDSIGINTKDLIFSHTADVDQAQGVFLKEYYYYDTIDNIVAKIRVPKLYDTRGKIGISFNNIDDDKRLTIYSKNLNEENQKLLLNCFHTIDFKE